MAYSRIGKLKQFSLSVDILDNTIYGNIKSRLNKYITSTLKARFFEVLIDGIRVDSGSIHQPGLKTVWTNREEVSTPVFCDSGTYAGQSTYAYHNGKALWITAPDKDLLINYPNECIDLWSKCPDLPPYRDYGGSDTKTSIIIPLRYGGRVFGFFNMEFPDHYECTQAGKTELLCLSESLSRIVWLYETSRTQLQDTQMAFGEFEEELNSQVCPLKKPQLFLATPNKADDAVVAIVRNILAEFSEELEVIYWKNISDSGNINFQILDAISNSSCGICYFSEEATGNNQHVLFVDNPNVVFEAGMLQALTNNPEAKPTGWIPLREDTRLTTPIPFDFAAERIIVVTRDSNNVINDEDLKTKLRDGIRSLVSEIS